ncbi:hypothetical protein [Natronolimnobius sp. AArcel1]|uniref:hypothetical protein n=1 Tax=Natronolimnobius sp. AArcel1 TaxID=1679093 RepID=UPI0013EBF4EC|nr:hypothetical protein [Natronolimnobius sp. AArcel1]
MSDELAANETDTGPTTADSDGNDGPDSEVTERSSGTSTGDSSRTSQTNCPRCGSPVTMEVVTGPTEARVSPCGCRVAPGFLERQ